MSPKKILGLFSVLVVSAIATYAILNSNQSQAANMASFKAGNIISNTVFTNNNTMTANDIQNFLNSKNSCLKDRTWPGLYDINGNGLIEDKGAEWYGVWGTMTSAQIIKAAADIYRINPQVILVLLQKESSIITGNCNYINTAMGAACPDYGVCDDSKKGFVAQIDYGVSYLRGYMNGKTNYPVGTNFILYHPYNTAHCGGSYVYVENLATGALYTYTPYQPNQAALSAGYGLGDSCSSYGNRNFFAYFTDWFGSTQGYTLIGAIGEHYYKSGGDLGSPTGNEICTLVNGGCYQTFEKGSIYWTEATGAWSVIGGIKDYWATTRYENGYLGYPTSNEHCTTSGCYQAYQNGRIYWQEHNGAHDIHGGIGDRYKAVGYATGHYGYPLTNEICGLKDKGCYQVFERGNLYWIEETGAWDMKGAIKDRWYAVGFEYGYLGYPIGTEVSDNGGVYQKFQNGTVYWSSSVGAWDMGQTIYNRWKSVKSWLGNPTSRTYCGLIAGGCYQVYQNGSMYWTKNYGSWEVLGGIKSYWISLGSEWGTAGYPTSGEYLNNGAVRQDFERGSIYWTEARGAWFVAK